MNYTPIPLTETQMAELFRIRKENASLRAEVDLLREDKRNLYQSYEQQRQQLAISQLEAKRLREALEEFVNGADECLDDGGWVAMVVTMEAYHICDEAISSPTSTEALDAYVAEIQAFGNTAKHLLSELLAVLHGDGGHHEYKVGTVQAVEDAMQVFYKRIQQRDLAVSAIENLVKQKGRHNTEIAYKKLVDVLAAIKESEE